MGQKPNKISNSSTRNPTKDPLQLLRLQIEDHPMRSQAPALPNQVKKARRSRVMEFEVAERNRTHFWAKRLTSL